MGGRFAVRPNRLLLLGAAGAGTGAGGAMLWAVDDSTRPTPATAPAATGVWVKPLLLIGKKSFPALC